MRVAGIEPARLLGREILSLLCLPISPHSQFGAPGETRTPKIWLLRPTRIPIPSPGLKYSMIDCNTSTDILYEKSANLTYHQPTYHTIHRTYVPDPLLNRPKPKFVPMEILVSPPGNDPGSSDFQSVAMTSSAKATFGGS